MTELDSLLQAILREPGEDLPRLVYADWLDDHAGAMPDPVGARARATFIRCQIELAKVNPRDCNQSTCNQAGYGPCRHCRDVEELHRRERSLFQNNACDWLKNWTGSEQLVVEKNAAAVAFSTMPPGSIKYEFRRGFLSRISGTWEDLSQHLDAILADPWVPGLDEVELTTEPELLDGSGYHALSGKFMVMGKWIALKEGESLRDTLAVLKKLWPAVRSWKLPSEPRANPDPLPNGFFADLFSQEPAT